MLAVRTETSSHSFLLLDDCNVRLQPGLLQLVLPHPREHLPFDPSFSVSVSVSCLFPCDQVSFQGPVYTSCSMTRSSSINTSAEMCFSHPYLWAFRPILLQFCSTVKDTCSKAFGILIDWWSESYTYWYEHSSTHKDSLLQPPTSLNSNLLNILSMSKHGSCCLKLHFFSLKLEWEFTKNS